MLIKKMKSTRIKMDLAPRNCFQQDMVSHTSKYDINPSPVIILNPYLFFSDFIILPGFIDFAADEVVGYSSQNRVVTLLMYIILGFNMSTYKKDIVESSVSIFAYGYCYRSRYGHRHGREYVETEMLMEITLILFLVMRWNRYHSS